MGNVGNGWAMGKRIREFIALESRAVGAMWHWGGTGDLAPVLPPVLPHSRGTGGAAGETMPRPCEGAM